MHGAAWVEIRPTERRQWALWFTNHKPAYPSAPPVKMTGGRAVITPHTRRFRPFLNPFFGTFL